jgi:hypothetical protein
VTRAAKESLAATAVYLLTFGLALWAWWQA